MILTLNDKREISQIIASFTDEDYERINSEVDRLCKRCDPISEMLRSYKPDEHTKDAIDWLEDDDCDYQEKAAEWFWDAISCSERMPEDTKMLLAFSQGKIVAAYWNWVMSPIDYKKYRAFTYLSGNILDDVTHWMPLLEPPEQDGE
ncbi:TPA: DUF551 domain-containing protein [Escherichia coli]|nr:DUF551 domain-containing protein [Escherichia coli]HAW9534787.1 DUF551 domain-containing protein [Escherichia coli]